jgi:hypothetical protein
MNVTPISGVEGAENARLRPAISDAKPADLLLASLDDHRGQLVTFTVFVEVHGHH